MKKALVTQSGGSVQEADLVASGSSAGGSESSREALPLPSDSKKKQQKNKDPRGSRKFWKT